MVGFKSIRSRILAFAVLATLVPSLGLGLLTYSRHQAMVDENVAVELRTIVNYAHAEVSHWIADRVDDVRAVSSTNTILERLTNTAGPGGGARDLAAPRVEAYLRSVQGRLGSMLELRIFDSDGTMLASSAAAPQPVELPVAWREHLQADGVVHETPRWDDERNTATMTVIVPILSTEKRLLGALWAILDLGRVHARLEAVSRFSVAEIVLLSPDGEPVLGTRGEFVGPDRIGKEALKALQGQPGGLTSYLGHRGRAVVGVAGAPLLSTMSIVAERDSAGVYRDRRRLLELFAALTAALTLLVGGLAWWLGRSIVIPLDSLVRAVDRVAGGDLGVHLPDGGSDEVGRLTRSLNEMADRLRLSRDEVERANQALQRQNRLLEELAVTDGLTGVNNRKKLDSTLAEQLALFRRHHRPFAVIMLDLDHFKSLNDTYGHLAGDRVLAHVAGTLKRCVRSVDHVARYGGEEFAIVLVEATLDGAMDTAERIRAAIEASRIVVDDRQISVTVSLGVSRCREDDKRGEDVIARADAALYKAKYAGRNRVFSFDRADASDPLEPVNPG